MRAPAAIRVITLVVAAGGWELASGTGLVSNTVLPSRQTSIFTSCLVFGSNAYEMMLTTASSRQSCTA